MVGDVAEAADRAGHVTTPGHCRSRAGVHVHRSGEIQRVRHRGLPVTTVEHTIRDLARVVPARKLRRTLAEADYRHLLDVDVLEALLFGATPGRRQGYARP